MARLNQERQKILEPKRFEFAKKQIESLGYEIIKEDKTSFSFLFKNYPIRVYPYSGWFTGKTVVDGRGLNNLLEQIQQNQNN